MEKLLKNYIYDREVTTVKEFFRGKEWEHECVAIMEHMVEDHVYVPEGDDTLREALQALEYTINNLDEVYEELVLAIVETYAEYEFMFFGDFDEMSYEVYCERFAEIF